MLSQAIADLGHYKSFTYCRNHLLSFDKRKFIERASESLIPESEL